MLETLGVVNIYKEVFKALRHVFLAESASVVIPCYNEAATVGSVVKIALETDAVDEVVVIDDGSQDASAQIAMENGAKVVRHAKNLGKGHAIMSGARAAKNSVIVFIDADLEGVSPEMIGHLAWPVLNGETRLCKSAFDRDAGRVTELVAKPLLEFIYPEARFSQPLSGQFCIRKDLLMELDVSMDWGIDISIMLSALKKGEKIVEVNMGYLKHKHRELPSLAKTAREVTQSILQNAGFLAKKHRLIVFDFDGTLVQGSSIETISKQLGFYRKLSRLREKYRAGIIHEREITLSVAKCLRGTRVSNFREAAAKVRPMPYAPETLEYLRRMGYRMGVISFAFGRAIEAAYPQKYFDFVISPRLQEKEGRLTGKVSIPQFKSESMVFSKGKAILRMMAKARVKKDETIAVGNSVSDEEMFLNAGIAVAIGLNKKIGNAIVMNSYPELLIIAN